MTVEDVDSCVSKVEKLRSEYRSVYQEIECLFENDADARKLEFEVDYKIIISKIKSYIGEAKERRSKIRLGEAQVKVYVERLQDEKDNEVMFQKTTGYKFPVK